MQGPRRLLILATQYWPALGGSEAQVRLLAREFRRSGAEVEVWTRRLQETDSKEEMLDDLLVRRLGPSLPFRARWVRRIERATFAVVLYRSLRNASRRFDVVFANQPQYTASLAVLATRFSGLPIVARVSASGVKGEMLDGGLASRTQRQIQLRGLARVAALGPLTRMECEQAGFSQTQVVVIPNAVSIPSRQAPRVAGPVRAIWVGRFRAEKRADLAIAAWTQSPLPGTLCLVGGGDQEASLEPLVARCRALKGVDSVDMMGLLEDPRPELSQAHIFIQSSDTEGMSNALLEAMASGCACVATDVGETRFALGGESADRVRPGDFVEAEAGLLVRPADVLGMVRALNALSDVRMRERLAHGAYRRCVLNHGIDSVVGRYLEVFGGLGRMPSP